MVEPLRYAAGPQPRISSALTPPHRILARLGPYAPPVCALLACAALAIAALAGPSPPDATPTKPVQARPPPEAVPTTPVTHAVQERMRQCNARADGNKLQGQRRESFVKNCMQPSRAHPAPASPSVAR
jgi:hypothetical protein